MSIQENKEMVRRYLDAFNDFDRDALSAVLADDVVEHGATREVEGFDEFVEFVDRNQDTFSGYTGSTEAICAEDDLVTVRYTVSGTHDGEYLGIDPTGKDVTWSGIAMYRIENGEIAEIWIEEDRLELLQQLEGYDPPAHLRI
ncbi:DUF4440 domain-containing protein [Halobacteriales archaeon QS_1_68_17]|nr:MAG: DUF4440 domain-containing protein [Halobacteriales archaeon QS_1_68_17]